MIYASAYTKARVTFCRNGVDTEHYEYVPEDGASGTIVALNDGAILVEFDYVFKNGHDGCGLYHEFHGKDGQCRTFWDFDILDIGDSVHNLHLMPYQPATRYGS